KEVAHLAVGDEHNRLLDGAVIDEQGLHHAQLWAPAAPAGVEALHRLGDAFEALERDVDALDGSGDVDARALAPGAGLPFSVTQVRRKLLPMLAAVGRDSPRLTLDPSRRRRVPFRNRETRNQDVRSVAVGHGSATEVRSDVLVARLRAPSW